MSSSPTLRPAFHDAGAVISEAAALALSLIKDDKCYLVTFASLGETHFLREYCRPRQLAPASLAGGGAGDPPWTHQRLSLQPQPRVCLTIRSCSQPAWGRGSGYLLIRRFPRGRAGDRDRKGEGRGSPGAAVVTTGSSGDHSEQRPQADGPPFGALQSGPCDFTLCLTSQLELD